MNKMRIALTALAFSVAIGGAFATKATQQASQCPNNVAPAGCNKSATECCYLLINNEQVPVFRN